ncbi:MAG: thiaminase II [Thaumarchaeota archaeon]|jgi:thiaminase/transcriptional activator TenA|nr:thiaminase II [Candidatus Geocrenenecus arthurdayi]
MSKSSILREKASSIWEKILEHPFVVELYTGELPFSKFKYYVLQDYNYLVTMIKVLSIVSAKAPNIMQTKKALYLAYMTVTGEMENYEKLLSEMNLTIRDAVSTTPNPSNVAYMNFLLSTSYMMDYWATMAALLPCFWTYLEIAEKHKDKLESNPSTIYRRWASVYLSKEYKEIVDIFRNEVDSSSLTVDEMWPYFELASKYEYMFWSAAYSEEKWPI